LVFLARNAWYFPFPAPFDGDFGADRLIVPLSGAVFAVFGADLGLFARMKPDHPSQNGL